MKLTKHQAINIAQKIYGKQDERVKQIENLYKESQSNIIDLVSSFIANDKQWASKASPDEIATFISNLKDTFYNASADDQNLIKMAYNNDDLNTNGDMLMAKITQQMVRDAMFQKIQLGVTTQNIPDVVHADTYSDAKNIIRNTQHVSKQSRMVDRILYKSTENSVLESGVDSSIYNSINKQTYQTLQRIRKVAEVAAKSPKDPINWQNDISNILTGGSKSTNGQMGRAAGIIRTATAQSLNRSKLQDFNNRHVKRYQFISLEAPNTCIDCDELDGQIFNVDDAIEGVNFPLIHPNCQCTVIEVNEDDDWDTSDHDVTRELARL